MTAIDVGRVGAAQHLEDREARKYRAKLFAPCYPGLTLGMLVPRARDSVMPFPFNQSNARYYYLARNGIYALAQLWGLRDTEVLFPAFFHGVELEALLQACVRVRFYPVRKRLQVLVDDVVSRIGPKTRAIYLTHFLGFPGPVEELAEVAKDRGLLLIEDCAHALLSRIGDKPLGSLGDASIFCLYKTLPVPNGGVLALRTNERWNLPEGERPSWASGLALSADAWERHLQSHGGRVRRWPLAALRTAGKRVSRLL